jgi:hypothetical protein
VVEGYVMMVYAIAIEDGKVMHVVLRFLLLENVIVMDMENV